MLLSASKPNILSSGMINFVWVSLILAHIFTTLSEKALSTEIVIFKYMGTMMPTLTKCDNFNKSGQNPK